MSTEVSRHAAALMHALETAWNAHDGAAFGAAFTDDAEFVDIRGDLHRSRAAIANGHQAIFDSIYRGSSVSYELVSARPLGSGVAVAHVSTTLQAPVGPMAGTNHSTFTMVLLEREGSWRITALQNTLVPPAGRG